MAYEIKLGKVGSYPKAVLVHPLPEADQPVKQIIERLADWVFEIVRVQTALMVVHIENDWYLLAHEKCGVWVPVAKWREAGMYLDMYTSFPEHLIKYRDFHILHEWCLSTSNKVCEKVFNLATKL